MSGTLDVGDSVTVHGASAGDIRYVHVSDSLGEKSSFEGHLVKTTDGLEIFGDSAVMWFKVDEDLDVVDHGAQKTDKSFCSSIRFKVEILHESPGRYSVGRICGRPTYL